MATAELHREVTQFLVNLFQQAERFYGPIPQSVVERQLPDVGKLARKKVLAALRDRAKTSRRRLSADRRRAALKVMRASTPVARLVSRNTRELLRAYYAAGKIDSTVATRRVEDEFVDMTDDEAALYEAVEDYISSTYDNASVEVRSAVGFVMTIYRRRMASCFRALGCTLSNRLEGLESQGSELVASEDDLSDDETRADAMDEDEAQELESAALRVEEQGDIAGLLRRVRALPTDTKAAKLAEVIEKLQRDGFRQVMVFTQYTDTMDFLREYLLKEHGWRVLCFSGRGGELPSADGTWRKVSRDETKRIFREGQAEILLCTDAAAEGLNFQFCGSLVNYDMPWNPMRVEQRIGRIDRLGQDHEEIRIVNLHYRGTVETDVYVALRSRIGLFSQFVGKLQPILASLPKSIAGAALAGRDQREKQKRDLLGKLDEDVRDAEEAGFDLDEVAAADVEVPTRPAPLYDLDDLDAVIRRPELLPDGAEVGPLGNREYSYVSPGMAEPLRVTTNAQYFDQHPDSVELWSPGSPLFQAPDDVRGSDTVPTSMRISSILGRAPRPNHDVRPRE